MSDYFNSDTTRIIIATASFIALLVIVFFIYRYVFKILRRKVSMAPGKLDGFILNLFKVPALWFIYWVLLEIFIHFFLKSLSVFSILLHINAILLIFSIAWISIQFIKAGSYYLQNKLNIGASDNLRARKSLTQIKVFKGIANTLIIIISIAIGLLTFEQVRSIGISLLTSAGIFGIIIGFAAQKSIGMILAGIQIAITQPIRLDDVVIVEGEWGRIEEITLTYVVVKIWDDRRLVMPVTSFLEKPFQNWTRTNSAIMGTVFLYVDYSFPVDAIRKILPDRVNGNSDWDGRVLNVQVTKASEQCKEIRILLSSTDASKNWDLRADIREKLIDFINVNYPDTFAKIRIKTI
jgi:small-conductance mechanosensitive channel